MKIVKRMVIAVGLVLALCAGTASAWDYGYYRGPGGYCYPYSGYGYYYGNPSPGGYNRGWGNGGCRSGWRQHRRGPYYPDRICTGRVHSGYEYNGGY